MPIYSGSSENGSDLTKVEGMYMSPDGKSWSSVPYKKTREDRAFDRIDLHLDKNNNRSYKEEYELICKKESKLARYERDILVQYITNIEGTTHTNNT